MKLSVKQESLPLRSDAEGVVRVGETRVPLDTVVRAFLCGATPEEIVQQYPSLELGDVYASIWYYLRNRDEVEEYLRARRAEAESVRSEWASRTGVPNIRERLLARRSGADE